MFKIGDYVMYKTEGVCRIDQITTMDNFPKDKHVETVVLIQRKDT
ncbi:MAG: hypothetical protein MR406_07140 [Blautia sp.]|nr:hypothetical protein [Blautia sp.]